MFLARSVFDNGPPGTFGLLCGALFAHNLNVHRVPGADVTIHVTLQGLIGMCCRGPTPTLKLESTYYVLSSGREIYEKVGRGGRRVMGRGLANSHLQGTICEHVKSMHQQYRGAFCFSLQPMTAYRPAVLDGASSLAAS